MNPLFKISGVSKIVTFYRYIYFDGPRWVTGMGIMLILLVGLIHLLEAPEHVEVAGYVGALFLVNFVASVVAAIGIYRGARSWGWAVGAVISSFALAAYVLSRTLGLPEFGEGTWANPVGTVAMGLEALYIGLYFSIVTGMNVAVPNKRNWHD